MKSIDPTTVREYLDYSPGTGVFVWKRRAHERFPDDNHAKIWNNRFAGKVAGRPNPFGYRTIAIHGVEFYAHRLAWAHYYGEDPIVQIDHRNGTRSDNRIENLRKAPNGKNNMNTKCRSHSVHSQFKGVGWFEKDKRWRARIAHRGKTVTRYFRLEIDAARAYDEMAIELFGEFAKTNKAMGLLP